MRLKTLASLLGLLGDGVHPSQAAYEAPLTFNFKLPDKIDPGVYDIGMTETAAEGSAIVRYGGKITVSP